MWSWVPVAYANNPSYSRGRNKEDHGSKLAWANSLRDPILKKLFTKRAGGVTRGVILEFKPQYCQKKKKRRYLPVHSTKCFTEFKGNWLINVTSKA
jgi:hypothetical protein